MCPNFGATQQHRKFLWHKHIKVNSVPGLEQKVFRASSRKFGVAASKSLVFTVAQLWRVGRKLLVLGLGRQSFVGFGVVDDVTEQFLAERCQRTLPQLPRGLALLDEDPLLGGDRAGIHLVGAVVDAAAGERIALPDGPFDRRDAAMP